MTPLLNFLILGARAPLSMGWAWFWLGAGLLVFVYVLGKLIRESRRNRGE